MLKRLFPYFKGYKRQAILAPVLIALETICELILPLLMAEIIDSGIQKGDMPVILKMGALMLVVAAAAMYFGVMSSKHAAFAAQGLGANLRKAQFDKISTFSFGNIDRFSTASLVTRLTNDVTNVQNMVAMALRLLIRSGVLQRQLHQSRHEREPAHHPHAACYDAGRLHLHRPHPLPGRSDRPARRPGDWPAVLAAELRPHGAHERHDGGHVPADVHPCQGLRSAYLW